MGYAHDPMTHMLTELTQEELGQLAESLWRAWGAVADVYGFDSEAALEAEWTYMPIANELWGRELGCRWTGCPVCRHASCGFCPGCNPDAYADDAPSLAVARRAAGCAVYDEG